MSTWNLVNSRRVANVAPPRAIKGAIKAASKKQFTVVKAALVKLVWNVLKVVGYLRFKYSFYSFPIECNLVNSLKDRIVGW